MTMKDWKMFDVLQLIKNYREHECLWNYNSDKYKRQDLKKAAWFALAAKYGKSVNEIKKKVKYLRSAYVNEKKRVDDSKRTVAPGDSFYQPQLYYYDQFRFLDPVIVLRKSTDNNGKECVEERLEETVDNDNATDEMNIKMSIEDVSLPQRRKSPSKSPSLSRCPTPSSSVSTPLLKAKKKKIAVSGGTFNKYREVLGAIVNLAKDGVEDNLYNVFGKNIALQLNELSPYEATAAMSEIHQLLSMKIMNSMLSSESDQTRNHK